LVSSALARAWAPSAPMLLSMNVHRKQIQQTKAEKRTVKVQRRERCVGLERIGKGLGTVIADAVVYKRPS